MSQSHIITDLEKKSDRIAIPNILHFIWIGGYINLSKVATLNAWARKNPNYVVRLYIDKKRLLETIIADERDNALDDSGLDYFESSDAKEEESLYQSHQVEIALFNALLESLKIRVLDINEDNLSDEYIQYEINRALPNYGAASDLLRLNILFKYGGIYCDCDIEPFDDLRLPHHFLSSLGVLFKPSGNNDIIAAEKGCLLIKQFIAEVRSNYDRNAFQMSLIKKPGQINDHYYPEAATYYYNILYKHDTRSYRFTLTLERAGPFALRNFLIKKSLGEYFRHDYPIAERLEYSGNLRRKVTAKKIFNQFTLAKDFLQLETSFFKMESSGLLSEWMGGYNHKRRLRFYDSNEIILKTINSILFEIRHMGLLHFSSHIENVVSLYHKYYHNQQFSYKITRTTDEKARDLLFEELLKKEHEPILEKITGLEIIPHLATPLGMRLHDKIKKARKDIPSHQPYSQHLHKLSTLAFDAKPTLEFHQKIETYSRMIVHECAGSADVKNPLSRMQLATATLFKKEAIRDYAFHSIASKPYAEAFWSLFHPDTKAENPSQHFLFTYLSACAISETKPNAKINDLIVSLGRKSILRSFVHYIKNTCSKLSAGESTSFALTCFLFIMKEIKIKELTSSFLDEIELSFKGPARIMMKKLFGHLQTAMPMDSKYSFFTAYHSTPLDTSIQPNLKQDPSFKSY